MLVIIPDHESISHVLARLKISRAPVYKDVLKLGQEREGALLLDIGCCCTSGAPYMHEDAHVDFQLVTTQGKLLWMASLPNKFLRQI